MRSKRTCHLFRVTAGFVLMAVSSALLILTAALGGVAARLGGGRWGGGEGDVEL